jgi:hypothetical protein
MSAAQGSKALLKNLTKKLAKELSDTPDLLSKVNSGECTPAQLIVNLPKD